MSDLPADEGTSSTGLALVTLVVRDYDDAIAWFTNCLRFSLLGVFPASLSPDATDRRQIFIREAPEEEAGGCTESVLQFRFFSGVPS